MQTIVVATFDTRKPNKKHRENIRNTEKRALSMKCARAKWTRVQTRRSLLATLLSAVLFSERWVRFRCWWSIACATRPHTDSSRKIANEHMVVKLYLAKITHSTIYYYILQLRNQWGGAWKKKYSNKNKKKEKHYEQTTPHNQHQCCHIELSHRYLNHELDHIHIQKPRTSGSHSKSYTDNNMHLRG